MLLLAIDGGTSNTRASVVASGKGVLASAAEPKGIADVARAGERAIIQRRGHKRTGRMSRS